MNPIIPPINTADSLFHDGNPATGELGTIVSAEWLNNMQGALRGNQSELIALLTAAGIEPSAAKADQVLTAMRSLFLGKTGQAADSAKLEGHPASYFAKADDLADASQLATEVARLWAQKLDVTAAFGVGQAVQNVTGSRSINTIYYNTTGRPIYAFITLAMNATANAIITINGVAMTGTGGTTGATGMCSALIPAGASYSVSASAGTPTITSWTEFR
ncbi:hypothetical protein [Laribacter hongkongensis]|uniref:Putative phage tail protein n=1 Tax=Laribacter hongkongensis TaxID=168471 RepID=A0A248LN41_9NEIS|nr:hypothetical protein [Laribacter hongkongensis]ASJ26200.1 putative phage tail protein [Laribacter hongkongensis]MCG9041130.1 hypothetical protein [Laribacter hongkongensis]MCG9068932.1 hypothetical protein [Laribacter hongkongensis]MCG9088327.1 hypothetical protein [Laribacter hongkongensis]MCG9110890.1 hypothetical protein [Laribacter hongkongensis]